MNYAPFVHLRNHTAYSLAEGALRIPQLANMCKEYNMPAVAITDTNNIFGGAEFSKYIPESGVQPILGTQISVDFGLPSDITIKEKYSQLILLVQNDIGYQNIIKLLSYAYLKKLAVETPHINFSDLKEHCEGLIALSGGVKGVIGQALIAENKELAEAKCLELLDLFKDRFYIELMRHNLADEIKTEDDFLDLAYKHNIPIVATNECYFATKDMYQAHDILLCITDGKYVDETDRRHETEEHYFKTAEEMVELFSDLPEAIENTVNIAKRCGYKVKKSPPLLPHVEKGADEPTLLKEKAYNGLKERLETSNIIGEEEQKPYYDRLEYELGVIIQMGFSGYFLIVADFIGWAKRNNIPVGPGRGSGAGSIVAWSMKITDLNPLRFSLLFERFLNPERVNMPDFDIDFCQDRRGEVIHYIQEKYGFDSVGQIITFGKLQAKNAIKDVGRVLRLPYSKCDDLCKMIPFKIIDADGKDVPITIANVMTHIPDFKQAVDNDDVLKGLINIALKLEGLFRNAGTHAAGVVIGDRPIDQLVALYKDDKSDIPATQYNMKYVESTGLIKYDFLGLKTLTIIQKACDMIYKNHNIKIDISNIPIDDKETYELIASANTAGIFQLESKGMQDVILEMKPNRIEDLVALVALYRPGPMDNIPVYIRRKFGEEIEYLHPLMEPILRETYGIMVYQEQVMEMGKSLAGYSLGASDLLRRAMGKKIKEEMIKQREIFKQGCLKYNNIDEETSMKIFDLMEKFANYGFNKSHAACYAWICYQTAYLKTHYPAEFMAATMTYDMTDADKLSFFADNIKSMGIKLLRPDINKSYEYFSVEDGNIRYSMAGIKSVGVGAVKEIVKERETNGEFKNVTDFIERIGPKTLNRRMLENLIKAGAFDSLEPNRAKMFENVPYIMAQIISINQDKEINQTSLFSLDEMSLKRDDIKLAEAIDWKPLERLKFEHEAIGFYVSAHPLDIYENVLKSLNAISSEELKSINQDRKATFAGIVDNIKSRFSKAGNKFYIVSVSDTKGTVEILFSERNMNFGKNEEYLKSGQPVAISCDVKTNNERVSIFGGNVEILSINTQLNGTLHIIVKSEEAVSSIKKTLGAIGSGYTNIEFTVFADNKKAIIPLRDKYNITTENLELFKTIKNIEFSF
ncbi:DNA polymerase III subunit alpha [bacterium]|nr:DNA polymerase III subunit alpha [bacterium]